MDIKKLAPWNWFKTEEEEAGAHVPVKMDDKQPSYSEENYLNPIVQLHQEMDKLFENTFRGFGFSPFRSELFKPLTTSGLLKPQVDIGANDKEYTITVEVPGVSEKDVQVEVANNIMTIKGEKKQEKEEKDKDFYRIERSYGSFQRVLSLPDDADQADIKATFKNGILKVKMPRKALPASEVKQVDVKVVE